MDVIVASDLLPVSEASRQIPLSLNYLYQQIQKKKIPSIRLYGRIYLERQVVEQMRDEQRDQATETVLV